MHIFAKFLMRLWMALSFLWTLACGAMLLFGGIDSEKEKMFLLGLWLVPIGLVWLCAMLLIWVVSAFFEKDNR